MNMNKAYRAELRDLKRAERNTNRDFHVGHAEIQRAYREACWRCKKHLATLRAAEAGEAEIVNRKS